MLTRQGLLDLEDKGWRALCERFNKLGPDGWLRPGAAGEWSPRDVLAHVACWHAEAAMQFERNRTTGEKVWWPDVEEFNADAHERCRDMTLHDVQVMSGAAHHRFREEVNQLEQPVSEKIARWVRGCADAHYEEHIAMLDAFLGASS